MIFRELNRLFNIHIPFIFSSYFDLCRPILIYTFQIFQRNFFIYLNLSSFLLRWRNNLILIHILSIQTFILFLIVLLFLFIFHFAYFLILSTTQRLILSLQGTLSGLENNKRFLKVDFYIWNLFSFAMVYSQNIPFQDPRICLLNNWLLLYLRLWLLKLNHPIIVLLFWLERWSWWSVV